MNKTLLSLGLSFVLMGISSPVFSQTFTLQVGSFMEEIAPSYFNFAGLPNVQHEVGPHNFHQYLWGKFPSYEAALNQAMLFQKQENATVFNNIKVIPSNQDIPITPITHNLSVKTTESTNLSLFSRALTFSNAALSFQNEQVGELENIIEIMMANPELKLRILGKKVDSLEEEDQPADKVEQFLLANNIPAYRIKIVESLASEHSTQNPQVIMALVNLKEEIILDRFGSNHLMVKQMIDAKSVDILE